MLCLNPSALGPESKQQQQKKGEETKVIRIRKQRVYHYFTYNHKQTGPAALNFPHTHTHLKKCDHNNMQRHDVHLCLPGGQWGQRVTHTDITFLFVRTFIDIIHPPFH